MWLFSCRVTAASFSELIETYSGSESSDAKIGQALQGDDPGVLAVRRRAVGREIENGGMAGQREMTCHGDRGRFAVEIDAALRPG